MRTRILTISGHSPAARQAHLARCTAWMAERGWALADYEDELGSAVFHPAGDGGSLPAWHPRRLLPPPGAFDPGTWWAALRRRGPGPFLVAGGATVVAVALFAGLVLGVFGGGTPAEAPVPAEQWRFVTASSLNVRALPSGEAQIVGVFHENQRVLARAAEHGWAQVVQPEKGYVAARFLSEVPVAQ
jgi:hypothetical protein